MSFKSGKTFTSIEIGPQTFSHYFLMNAYFSETPLVIRVSSETDRKFPIVMTIPNEVCKPTLKIKSFTKQFAE